MVAQDITIRELVAKLVAKEIELPEMQRPYVWKQDQVADLLYSLYQDYPTGSILTWKARNVLSEDGGGSVANSVSDKELLLDGQQRLKSLDAVINGRKLEMTGGLKSINIMFNLAHPDLRETEGFLDEEDPGDTEEESKSPNLDKASSSDNAKEKTKQKKFERNVFAPYVAKEHAGKDNWISVTEALHAGYAELAASRAGRTDINDPTVKKYMDRIKKLQEIHRYRYRVTTLTDRTLHQVADIFGKINSQGTSLSGSDLAVAYIAAEWPSEKGKEGALPKLKEFAKKTEAMGYKIETGVLARNLVAFATGQPKFDVVPTLNRKTLESSWKKSKKGLEHAIEFMKGIGFYNLKLLSSPSFLITVAAFAAAKKYSIDEEDEGNLRFWAFMANINRRYSAASETTLAKDISAVGNSTELIRLLQAGSGGFDIKPESLEGVSKSNSHFRVFCIILYEKAKDWKTRLPIRPESFSSSELHHIFPKSQLAKIGIDDKKINDMANYALISAVTNKKISNTLPEDYLPDIDKKLLESQFIPTAKSLWKIKNYDKFLAARRKLIAEGMNEFLKVEEFKKKLKKR